MSTYTRRTHSPKGQYSTAGHRRGHDTHAQHGVVPNRKADTVNQPFPNKPVSHRRPQRTEVLLDFEKITVSAQPRGPLLPQEQHSKGIRETAGFWHSRKESHRLPSGELQMARAIHAKELMLQKKLRNVEEKVRQKMQRDGADTAAGDDQKSGEERHNRGQAERGKPQTKTRIPELQRREPVRSGDMWTQQRRQEDFKPPRKTQDQRTDNKMRNTSEVQQARCEVAETIQSKGKRNKYAHEVVFNEQKVSGELNKSRWQNVKEHTTRKGREDKDDGMWEETQKAKYSEHNKASTGHTGWTREKKYRERTCKGGDGSDDEQDTPQKSLQKTAYRLATENRRSAGGKLSGESTPPLVSSPSHCSRPQQGERTLTDNTYGSLRLLPCEICNRKFVSERLEKHIQICKKVTQSQRQVFNSYAARVKGAALEQFLKTHTRSETQEVLKRENQKKNRKGNISNLPQGRLRAGTSQPKRYK